MTGPSLPRARPDFARRYALRDRARENAQRTYRRCQHAGLSHTLNALEHMAGDVLRWSVAAPQGIAIAHPFLDRRLICLSLGIQTRLQPAPGPIAVPSRMCYDPF
jgi:hypothetical protein